MSVKKNETYSEENLPTSVVGRTSHSYRLEIDSVHDASMVERAEDSVDYSNPKIITIISWVTWLAITAANVYALVEIGLVPSSF